MLKSNPGFFESCILLQKVMVSPPKITVFKCVLRIMNLKSNLGSGTETGSGSAEVRQAFINHFISYSVVVLN